MKAKNMSHPAFFGAGFGVLLLGVLVSGNPAVSWLGKDILYPVVFFFLMLRYLSLRRVLSGFEFGVFFVFILISIVHITTFGVEVAPASFGFLLKLGIAFFLIKIVPGFLVVFPRVMALLSLISLVFFLPVLFGVDLIPFVAQFRLPLDGLDIVHVGVHNFHLDEERGRNSGMFWEPGAFSGYLVFALLLLLANLKSFNKLHGVALVAGVLTAQSTTGYLALFFVSLIFVFKMNFAKNRSVGALFSSAFFVLFACIGAVLYEEVPFLKEKIDQQFEMTESRTGNYEINRIGNFLYDLDLIAERPFFGWTPRQSLRGGDMDLVSAQGNGLTGFATNFGLVGFVTFLGAVLFSFVRVFQGVTPALLATISILILLVGEQFLSYPLFLVLFFLSGSRSPAEEEKPRVWASALRG